ncbi:hypothetical protein [Streptomyces sp. NPDC050263]|uniref:hypothetical protein n=1 Tax=Streptomyces sp. NPDC050263 TaxID=3155037 RepID=UPI00343FDB54
MTLALLTLAAATALWLRSRIRSRHLTDAADPTPVQLRLRHAVLALAVVAAIAAARTLHSRAQPQPYRCPDTGHDCTAAGQSAARRAIGCDCTAPYRSRAR